LFIKDQYFLRNDRIQALSGGVQPTQAACAQWITCLVDHAWMGCLLVFLPILAIPECPEDELSLLHL
jgi:hypothetical protein